MPSLSYAPRRDGIWRPRSAYGVRILPIAYFGVWRTTIFPSIRAILTHFYSPNSWTCLQLAEQ